MAYISNTDIISTVKSMDIRDLIANEAGIIFKKNTAEKCPFCGSGTGKNNSSAFNIKPSLNIFTCFACGKSGNPIEFIIYYKNLESAEAIQYLIKNYSNMPAYIPEKKQLTDFTKKIFSLNKNNKLPAKDYLSRRKINVYKLPENSFRYDKYANAVVFYDTEQKLINKRFVEPLPNQPKSVFEKGSSLKNAIYASTYDEKQEVVFITEGVINALSFFPYSAIAIFSTSNKFSDVEKLSKFIKNKKVCLAFDQDVINSKTGKAPGQECTDFYETFIIENQIKIISLSQLLLPENVDVNDLLQKNELKNYLQDTDNYKYLSISLLDKPLLQNTKNKQSFNRKHGFFVKNSSYFFEKSTKDYKAEILCSDFVLESMYRLNNELATRLVKIQQTEIKGKQKRELIEITIDDLTKDKFKRAMSKRGFNFIGQQNTLDRIFMYESHQHEKSAEIIETYGWQSESKLFVFADCAANTNNLIIKPNTLGMINAKNISYYIPSASPANLDKDGIKNFRDEFNYKSGKINFKKFAELFYNSNRLNGSIGTMFYINSLFRDIVFKNLSFFPYLFLYGLPGGGKTTFAEVITALFSDTSSGFDLKNISQAALSRVASQKRNCVNYFKEYKTDAEPYIEQYFKSGYDGTSRTLSLGGITKETITFKVESSGLLDSNFLPTNEEAVYTRMIILDFEKSNFTDKQSKAYLELDEHRKLGLGQITKELLNYRELYEDNFKDVFYSLLDRLKNNEMKHLRDKERSYSHVALMLTPYAILESVVRFPYSFETLLKIMVNHATLQYEKLTEFKSTSIFWQSVAYNKAEGKVIEYGHINERYHKEGRKNNSHFFKKNDSLNKHGLIYLKIGRLTDLHTFYVSFCRTKGIPYISFTELKAELISDGYEPFRRNKTDNRKGINTSYLGTCYAFAYTINQQDDTITIGNLAVEL